MVSILQLLLDPESFYRQTQKIASDPIGGMVDSMGEDWDAILDVMGIDEGSRKQAINALSGVPVIGDILQGMDKNKAFSDYLKNTGQTWDDVKYPALANAGSTNIINAFRSGTNFVSKNIERLYK